MGKQENTQLGRENLCCKGLFISKLSRAYVQQEVRKAPQKDLLKAIVKIIYNAFKTLLTTVSKI